MKYCKLGQKREYGLDILRCLSMLMVIILHMIGHGGMRNTYAPGSIGAWAVSLLEIAAYPAVDCFVLLSGYLLSALPFKLSRIVRVWLPALFWSVLIQSTFFLLNPDTISSGKVLFMFLPVLSARYWFLNAYIVMMLVSPALNRLLRNMPRWQMRGLLLALLAVFCVSPIFALGNDVFKTQNGYAFPWFIVMYLCGGYIRHYCPRLKQAGLPLIGYLLLVLSNLLWSRAAETIIPDMKVSSMFMNYASVPVFCSALCMLQFFRNVQLSSQNALVRLAQRLSPLIFGVYLIHDHPLIRASLIQGRFENAQQISDGIELLLIAGIVLGIYALCIFMDWLRSLVFRALRLDKSMSKLCDRITEKTVILLNGE